MTIKCSGTLSYKTNSNHFQGLSGRDFRKPHLFSRTFQTVKMWGKKSRTFKDFRGPATTLSDLSDRPSFTGHKAKWYLAGKKQQHILNGQSQWRLQPCSSTVPIPYRYGVTQPCNVTNAEITVVSFCGQTDISDRSIYPTTTEMTSLTCCVPLLNWFGSR